MGIDYGLAKIGLACSDANGIMALPLGVIITKKWTLQRQCDAVVEKILEKQAAVIVVGLPQHLDGNHSAQTEKTLLFIDCLKKKLQEQAPTVEVKTFDERLTSKQADVLLKEVCMSRKQRDKKNDETSAYLILDTYLNQTRIPPKSF